MNYKKIKPVFILILVVSLAILPRITLKGNKYENISFEIKPEANKKWTLMLYFCADTRISKVTSNLDNSENYLHDSMLEAITGIVESDLLAGSEVDINVIALYDFPYSLTDQYGHAYIYELKAASVGGNTTVADWGQTNMGDGQTLDDFVDFCKTNYPADYYALSLVDHGRAYAGFCFDYHAPHPSMTYALGDCLTLPEIENSLSGTNNVDVLIFNTCLGGSFEVAWQFVDEVSYIIAGETTLGSNQLYTPREYVYNLSRNTDMTPKEFARMAFEVGVTPVVLPEWRDWGTIAIYDLTQFPVATLGLSFMETFDLFVESLHDELDYNSSKILFFKELRYSMGTDGLESSSSMLVDLYDCIEIIVDNQLQFHYATIGAYGAELLTMLESDPNGVLVDRYNQWDENHTYPAPYLQGFSLCFPDSKDMYHGYLYPNMYADLKVSKETRWDGFLNRLFQVLINDKFKLKDFYEIQLFIIDPSIKLDVFFEVSPEEIYHVGLNDAFPNSHMGIEIGMEGAEYYNDLFGNFMIRIPKTSLALSKANGAETFQVVVDASYAASATQDVNLTVKHITNDEIVWQKSKTHAIEIGQALTTEISTDDEMTDFEVSEIEPTTKKFGITRISNILIFSVTSIIIAALVVYRKKNKF